MLWCQNRSRTRQEFWHFSIYKRAQLSATRITEQFTLLKKSNINRLCINFSSILVKNGQSNLVLVLESKALSNPSN